MALIPPIQAALETFTAAINVGIPGDNQPAVHLRDYLNYLTSCTTDVRAIIKDLAKDEYLLAIKIVAQAQLESLPSVKSSDARL